MAAKHTALAERPDFERICQENVALRDELRSLREDLESERKTNINGQLLESFKARHNEESRKFVQAKKLSDSLAEENAQLKAEIKCSFHGRHSNQNGTSFGGHVLKELDIFGRRFEVMHRDLMESSLMKNLKGKHVINQGNY
jgi:hypothetical protein